MACPECGFVYATVEILAEHTIRERRVRVGGLDEIKSVGVKCPRCAVYTLYQDFWVSQYDKWGWERAEPVDIIDD